jgi:hypothetical protein
MGEDARVDSLAREMALAWGATHVIVDTTRFPDRAKAVYTQHTAHLRGKPALTTETGYLGQPEPEMVERNVDGALRVLRHLGMLSGAVERRGLFGHFEVLTSPETGVAPAVERGTAGGRRGDGRFLRGDRVVKALLMARSYVVATRPCRRGACRNGRGR